MVSQDVVRDLTKPKVMHIRVIDIIDNFNFDYKFDVFIASLYFLNIKSESGVVWARW